MADLQEAVVSEGGGSADDREPNAVGQPADQGYENSNISRLEGSDPPLAGEEISGGECDVISLDDGSVSEDGPGAVDGVNIVANPPTCEREDRVGAVDIRPTDAREVQAEAGSTTAVDSVNAPESRAATSDAEEEEEEAAASKTHAGPPEVSCAPDPRITGEPSSKPRSSPAVSVPRDARRDPGPAGPGEDGPDREIGVDPGSSPSDADAAAAGTGQTKSAEDQAAGKEKYPIYHIKWLKWKGESTAIITQNENGPCPLLAIMNVLLLSWKIRFPAGIEIITAEQLMECLGDFILETVPKEFSEDQRLNYEQNVGDAIMIMHKLQTGLDVNVRFTGVTDFEYTPECIVFDLLVIPLYHGWLVDPQNTDVVKAVGKCSYNQLVEKIISSKNSQSSEEVTTGIIAEQFLDNTATQLTYHGLCEVNKNIKEGELCVFFRNNHFSTIYKHKGQLYLLVTDQGFLREDKVVWESLQNVDGDGNFFDANFGLRPPSEPSTTFVSSNNQEQIDQQEQGVVTTAPAVSDLEFAKQLQEEENIRAAQFYQDQERQQQPRRQQPSPSSVARPAVESVAGAATGPAATPGPLLGPTSGGDRRSRKQDEKRCRIL
uniref:ubiquitin carboxyl-terminal hydrolase MINDY-1-like isoform X2 n=1 Tax=Myxine glutinosa TaxID=7769 RepID=UPI00358F1AA8